MASRWSVKAKPDIQYQVGDTLKKMLYYEQTNTCNTAFILTPVEIETTQLGMNFAALKSVIS